MKIIKTHEQFMGCLMDYYNRRFLKKHSASCPFTLALNSEGEFFTDDATDEFCSAISVQDITGDVAYAMLSYAKPPDAERFASLMYHAFCEALTSWWSTTRDIMYEDEKDDYIKQLNFYQDIIIGERIYDTENIRAKSRQEV